MFYIGACHAHGCSVPQDLTHALHWYEKAAEQGYVVAMFNLAFSYRKGDGVPQDYERMRYWLLKAAELGDPDSQRDLGWCYHEGIGVPVDCANAALVSGGSPKGDRKAQFNLGLSYLAGEGVKAPIRWGRYWLEKAAHQGHRQAKAQLRRLSSVDQLVANKIL